MPTRKIANRRIAQNSTLPTPFSEEPQIVELEFYGVSFSAGAVREERVGDEFRAFTGGKTGNANFPGAPNQTRSKNFVVRQSHGFT
jgi:hypothetical protein